MSDDYCSTGSERWTHHLLCRSSQCKGQNRTGCVPSRLGSVRSHPPPRCWPYPLPGASALPGLAGSGRSQVLAEDDVQNSRPHTYSLAYPPPIVATPGMLSAHFQCTLPLRSATVLSLPDPSFNRSRDSSGVGSSGATTGPSSGSCALYAIFSCSRNLSSQWALRPLCSAGRCCCPADKNHSSPFLLGTPPPT